MAKNKNIENNSPLNPPNGDLENTQGSNTPPNQQSEEKENEQGNTAILSQQEIDANNGNNEEVFGTEEQEIASQACKDDRKVDVIFERYVNIDRYYKTSDGTSFFKKTDATSHAQKLEDKNITEINR